MEKMFELDVQVKPATLNSSVKNEKLFESIWCSSIISCIELN
jgi:hypothetical protein